MSTIFRAVSASAEILAALLIVPFVMFAAVAGLVLVIARVTLVPLVAVALMVAGGAYVTQYWPVF
jgi:hypothetical protein